MQVNPCHATLEPGFFGTSEGYLARVKTQFTPDNNTSSGYLIWVPEFSTGPTIGLPLRGNVFYWQNDNTGLRPLNDAGAANDPYGSDPLVAGNMVSAATINDPAVQLTTGTARDVRCLSACMKMTYFGKMQDAAGQVAFISEIPLASIIGSDNEETGIASNPMTVTELFRMSNHVGRLGVDTLEHIHRPEPKSAGFFHSEHDAALSVGFANNRTTTSPAVRLRGHTVFGFAWRGLPGPDANLAFEFIKNVEWRPLATLGVNNVQPQATPGARSTVGLNAACDKISRSWATRALESAASEVALISQAALSGAASGLGRRMRSLTQGAAEGYALEAALAL